MKRIQQIVTEKKGMTLIELIASLAIFSILTLGVATLLAPSIRIYVESTNLSRSNLMLSNVLDRISDEMMYANDITKKDDWPAGSPVTGMKSFTYESATYGSVRFQNDATGVQMLQEENGTLLFSEGYYIGNKVEVGVQLKQKASSIVPGETPAADVVCIQAVLYDKNGRTVGSQARYVDLLNTTVIAATP